MMMRKKQMSRPTLQQVQTNLEVGEHASRKSKSVYTKHMCAVMPALTECVYLQSNRDRN